MRAVLLACVIIAIEAGTLMLRVALWACVIAIGVAIVIWTLRALLGPGWGLC